jgi:hypothetical protein
MIRHDVVTDTSAILLLFPCLQNLDLFYIWVLKFAYVFPRGPHAEGLVTSVGHYWKAVEPLKVGPGGRKLEHWKCVLRGSGDLTFPLSIFAIWLLLLIMCSSHDVLTTTGPKQQG